MAAVMLLAGAAIAAAPDLKRILVLHSYHRGLGWTDSIAQGIDEVLGRSKLAIETFTEYMDTKRIFDEQYLDDLATLFRYKYRNRRFDVIISSDDHAFQFLLAHRDAIFPQTPVVFCGVNYFKDEFIAEAPGFTGVVESFSIRNTIDAALSIDPHLRRVYSVVDRTVTGKANLKLLEGVIPQYKGRLEFITITDADMTAVQATVGRLPANSIVLLLAFTTDRSGNTFSLEQSADLITAACNRPVFSFWDFHLNHGIVGGMITTGLSHGQAAAALALRIIGGERPADIPVIKESPNRYIFDHAVLKRFGIPISRLPAGSGLINRPPSFYEQHKRLVWPVVLIFGMLTLVTGIITVYLLRIRAAEGALRDSEARFRDLSEMLPETIYEIDLQDNFLYANKSGLEQFGYTPQDLETGIKVSALIDPSDHERLADNIGRLLQGKDIGLSEYTAVRKDGTRFSVISRSALIFTDGQPVGLRGFLIDISERKRLEEQFQLARRMESVGTLAGGIAHDFNNLLMGIQGRASLVQLTLDAADPAMAHIKGIEECVRNASHLTGQLLGFAQSGKYDLKATALNALIAKTVDAFGRTRNEVRIHKRFAEDLGTTLVDRNQIEQVLLNLLVNAWQAMPDGGDLTVATQNRSLSAPEGRRHGIEAGDYVVVEITDTGIGMDAKIRKRIFEPFFSTKSRARGTGLGLASAYGIVKNHGGAITVASEPGQGSTFTVLLPASGRPPEETMQITETAARGSETILLVDDEAMILSVGAELLKHLGYRVLTADSGKAALEKFAANAAAIDLVILDLIMPDVGGRETFERLRSISPNVRVLLSSGYSIDGEASEILDRGCNGFIQKPFNLQQLAQKLRSVLDG